jgi:hypothetical protein
VSAPQGLLIVGSSEAAANLYDACQFLAPDPFVFVETAGRKLPERGAVRIEDVMVVETDGCRNLTRFAQEARREL